MADKRISQLIERVDIANNDVLPIVASGATTTNKVTISTIQDWMQSNLDVGVTSVGLTMPSAFQVSGSPITTSGNINVTATGTASQYIRGDGSLADFPQGGGGGGASVSYYLNGSVSQGTIGGIAYLEMNKTPILGAGTDFTISSDGYIASFITDAGDPALLQIPAGNWNFETYLQASSGGGTPTFYIELYKVDSGGTATLIASNSGTPESISLGTNINPYFSAIAVPQTTLLVTDRLALRYYVSPSGRTITLHTENNTLCQIITTFTTGLTALNGLTAQVQNFATGTSGTNFGITSSGSIHTFNLPDASASARGVVTTGSQIFGGVKTFADGLSLPSAGGTNQASRFVNIGTIHQGSGGSNQIGFNNSNNIYFGKGLDNGGVIQWSNSAVRYYTLPNADGTLALTSDIPANIVTAPSAGTTNQIPKFTASRQIGNSAISDNGTEISMQPRLFVTSGGQQFVFTPNLGTTSNRIETTGSLPLEIVSGGNITFAAGGATPQITLASSGAVTFANKITINTPSDGIGVLLNGRTSDNFSSIRFGANTGGGQYNSINVSSSSFDIISIGNTPITFGTNTTGGGGTRMTIGGNGTITLAGALNGTSASFSGTLGVTGQAAFGTSVNTTHDVLIQGTTSNNTKNAFRVQNSSAASLFAVRNDGVIDLYNNTTVGGTLGVAGALNGTTAAFTLNQNAVSTISITNSDNTNSSSRARFSTTSGSVVGEFVSISTLGVYAGTSSNHDFNLITNGNTRFTIAASTGAATFSSSVTANGSLNGVQGGTQNLLIDWSGSSQVTTLTNTELFFGTNAQRRMTITSGGVAVVGHNSAVGTNFSPPIQVKGGAGAGNGFGIISAFNEMVGGLQLSSSGSNSLQITVDPDNLRASSEFTIQIDGTERMRLTSGGNVLVGFNQTTTTTIGRTFTTTHASANRGATLFYGINDGSNGGMFVYNVAASNPSLNSQYVTFETHEGGVRGGEVMRLTSDAYLRMASGTGGIQFNGDTAAANALDDYEEGTWTPVVIGSSTNGSASYTSQNGRYTKIGNVVYFRADIIWSSHTGTGNIIVNGLPFAIAQAYMTSVNLRFDQTTTSNNYLGGAFIFGSSVYPSIMPVGGGGPSDVPMRANGDMRFSGFYFV